LEFRKLIKFGNSSHVLSLPSSWLKKNNLNKGSTIYIEENGNNELILSTQNKEKVIEEKEAIIDITNKSDRRINREIVAAYINNYKTIKLIGKNLDKKAKLLKTQLLNFIGLEIMEHTSKYISARDFINIENVDLKHLVRRIDILTRAMLADAKKTYKKDYYYSLMERDTDINRLAFLSYRVAKFFICNPHYTKENNTAVEVVQFNGVVDHLERFADETKRIARFLRKIKLNKKTESVINEIFDKIEEVYLNVMKAFYTNDKQLALEVADKARDIVSLCEANENIDNSKYFAVLLERFKTIINHVRTMARLIYN